MAAPAGAPRLPPEVNRTLYVRNLPFNITPEDMYEICLLYTSPSPRD